MASKILWVDDEIETLKSQVIFLETKGYDIAKASNGHDAIDFLKSNRVDVVLLDESMPGMTGLETLSEIRNLDNHLPVVMITKNEAENIMEEAIGSQITDYLLKPVNPNQVLLALKKILDGKSLVSEKTSSSYLQEFQKLFMEINDNPNYEGWTELYKKLVHWDLQLQKSNNTDLRDIFNTQRLEANKEFCKFVEKNYSKWINKKDENRPTFSHELFKEKILPHIQKGKPMFFVLIDNLRYDQWKTLEPLFKEYMDIVKEETFCAILPTSTQYARNAIFSGMLPIEIEKNFPNEWKNDDEEGGKNLYEEKFFAEQLKRLGKGDLKYSYTKITNHHDGEALVNNIHNLMHNDINVIVYNFVDMLSHARTEMEVLKELANDEISYRSLTHSWFIHSPLNMALQKIAEKNITLIVTTDHGTTQVKDAIKVVGDKQATTNIRYKHGRNLNYNPKEVFAFKDPTEIGLPRPNVNSAYIFATEQSFICYPNNYNYYVNYFKNTFQHGGVSLEEMIIPIVLMESK